MDGGGTGSSAVPVYQKFVGIAKQMEPRNISMIIPAKWYTGGKGLDDFREDMLNDTHISYIADFDDSRLCFPTADIAGGICYFLWDAKHMGKCVFTNVKGGSRIKAERVLNENASIFIRDIRAKKIISKIKRFSEHNMAEQVLSRNPFGFTSNQTGNKQEFSNSIRMFTSKGWCYVNRANVLSNTDIIDEWKVMMSKTGAEHAGQADINGKKKVISRIGILAPREICSESYLILSCYSTKEEAKNHVKYMKTKFVRFLLSAILLTQNIARDKFQLIPIQDFSISWTDAELYKKYDLTIDEINYIEDLIKPME